MTINRAMKPFSTSRTLLAAAGLALIAQGAVAKTRTLEWEDGACVFGMRYDDAKIDAKKLQGTIDLLKSQSAAVPSPPFVYDPKLIETLDVPKFEADCAAAASAIRDAPLLGDPDIEALRRTRVEMVEDACKFGAAYMNGLRTPAAFRAYAPAAEACGAYVDALEGKTDLAKTWERIGEQQCADSGVEESCRATFQKTAKMGSGDAGMRLTVGMYGWNNCAAKYSRFSGEEAERVAELGRTVADAFYKRYKVRGNCVSN